MTSPTDPTAELGVPTPFSIRWTDDSVTPPELAAYLRAVHPEDRPELERALRAAAASPGPFASAHRVVADRISHVLWVGSSRDDGDAVEIVGHHVDLTGPRHATVERYVAESVRASEEHRASIERAKGIIMAEHGADEASAFAALRRRSNEANVKLRLLAELIVRERTSRGLITTSPRRTPSRPRVETDA